MDDMGEQLHGIRCERTWILLAGSWALLKAAGL